jgi:hypothetical protein
VTFKEREGIRKMKVLQKILFTAVAIIGLSIAASAQKHENDPKKPPPKDNPPVVTPNVKPPRGDDKPRKPKSEAVIFLAKDPKEFT